MNTNLVEFKNQTGNVLRGIHVRADDTKAEHVVIMLGGFERAATTERKFKSLSDQLALTKTDSFRFDVADVGLSDGDFYKTTTRSMADDLVSALKLMKEFGYKKISFVGHSHAGSTLSLLLNDYHFEHIVLIAPGTNQMALWQMWYTKEKYPDLEIDYSNYKQHFNESEYRETLSDISWSEKMAASHSLGPKLREVNSFIDYADNYQGYDLRKILVIHGTNDVLCPAETVNIDTPNKIMVQGGDHDLEKPAQMEQWLPRAVEFLLSN